MLGRACPTCGGSGSTPLDGARDRVGTRQDAVMCPVCGGSGRVLSVIRFDAYWPYHDGRLDGPRQRAWRLDGFLRISPASEAAVMDTDGGPLLLRPAVSSTGHPLWIDESQVPWILGGRSDAGYRGERRERP